LIGFRNDVNNDQPLRPAPPGMILGSDVMQKGSGTMRRWKYALIIAAALSVFAFAPAGSGLAAQAAGGGERFALVIGNSDYSDLGSLKNPVNDATDMAKALEELGFEVTLLLNADLIAMDEAVLRLSSNLARKADSTGFFYYAGHGVQSGGVNYLIPSEAKIPGESYLKVRALAAQTVMDNLLEARNGLNVIVLDACRDNPFSWGRSGTRGLTMVGNQPSGSIVVYATSAGSVALDGTGRNGVFTAELLKHLRTPGVEINEVFNRTGAGVLAATLNRQNPAVYNQFFGTAYLAGQEAPAAVLPSTTTTTTLAAVAVAKTKTPTLSMTKSYGSVTISTKSAGTLYLDDMEISALPAKSEARLDDIEVGSHSLRMRYADGDIEVYYFSVEKGGEVPVIFTWAPTPIVATMTSTTTSTTTTTTLAPVVKSIRSPSGLDMIMVEGGTFNMGSEDGEADQKPLHRVALSGFFMSAGEITVAQYRTFVQSARYKATAGYEGGMMWDAAAQKWVTMDDASWEKTYLPNNRKQADSEPVIMVNWYDAVEYCNWLSKKEGLPTVYTIKGTNVTANFDRNGYRLPTEAEWEYAARGGRNSKERSYAGSDSIDTVGWYYSNSGNSTQPAGMKAPNELGLCDMSGNVQEWCWDWYGGYSGSVQIDPAGPLKGEEKVCRGGAWINSASRCTPAFRLSTEPGIRCTIIGFRVVRNL
jgi:formylglycine-generating enzyme required for sulfatase activity